MRRAGLQGSVVTLICDGGERYRNTYYDDDWLAAAGHDLAPYRTVLDAFVAGRVDDLPVLDQAHRAGSVPASLPTGGVR